MQIRVLNIHGTEIGKKDLPEQFMETVRNDLIQRAVLVIQGRERQPYGADPRAGKRASVRLSKRRRQFRGTYGRGQSRVPRKALSRRGTQFNWVAAFAPGTVKGRKAHPPKASKSWNQKINDKERHKALRAALAATLQPELVKNRGHYVPKQYPFLVESKIETLKTTQEALEVFHKLGLAEEIARCDERTIRAGKGKNRGRKYKTKTGPLLVTDQRNTLFQAVRNIPGVDVVEVRNLNAYLLAPGAHPGRLTLFTEGAIETLSQTKLFTPQAIKPKKETSKQTPEAEQKKTKEVKKENKPKPASLTETKKKEAGGKAK